MAEKSIIDIPFAGGIDTKTDPFQVAQGKLVALQNGVFTQTGLIARRWGYTALSLGILGGGAIAHALAVTAFGSELLTYDGAQAYSYIQEEGAWSPRGPMIPVMQSDKTIIAGNYQQLSPDRASLGGIDVFAWEDSRNGIHYSVFDSSSGAAIVNDSIVTTTSSAGRVKLLPVVASNVILMIYDQGGTSIVTATISPATPTILTTVGVAISGVIAPCWFDACYANNGNVYIIYYKSGTHSIVTASLLNGAFSGVTWSTTIYTYTGSARHGLSCFADSSSRMWYGFVNDTPAFVGGILTTAGASFLANTTILSVAGANATVAICGIASGASGQYFCEVIVAAGGQSYQHETVAVSVTTGGIVSASTVIGFGLGIASKPFLVNGTYFLNTAFQTPQQASYICISWNGTTSTRVGRTLYGEGGGYLNNQDYMVPECQALTTNASAFAYANEAKGIPNTEAGIILSLLGVNVTTLNFAATPEQLSSAIAGSLYTVGGILQRYDGRQYVEAGFLVYPEEVTVTPLTTGGSMAAGTYFYSVTYEYEDAFGFNEPSQPCVPLSVTTTTATSSVQIVIPTLFLTNKTGVKLVVYRTTNNGTLLYRITSAALPTYNPWPAASTSTVTFTDTLADASIQSNGLMYTQPLAQGATILPNTSPPPCTMAATFDNRLWTNTTDEPTTLYYSQSTINGAPAQFCAALNIVLDPEGGAITAIIRMDSNFLIFKRNSIFYISGTGPDATGNPSVSYNAPVQLPTGGIGAATATVMQLTPLGVFFQAATGGIYLVDRSLNVTYKGAPVEAYTSTTIGTKVSPVTITSATVIGDQWVVFTGTPLSLVYDYYYDQWSTFTGAPHTASDSDVFRGGGDVLALVANGSIYLQSTSNSDAGTAIAFALVTGWLRQASLQGYQRIYHAFLLANALIGTVNFTAAFDGDTTATVSGTLTQSGTPSSPANYQWRLDILRKCQAMRLSLAVTQSATAASFTLSGLSLVVGAKRGGNKVPSSRQIGMS